MSQPSLVLVLVLGKNGVWVDRVRKERRERYLYLPEGGRTQALISWIEVAFELIIASSCCSLPRLSRLLRNMYILELLFVASHAHLPAPHIVPYLR
jgi:hypothetical protein